ncbi:polyketide cyclase/dehydrase and lipid transport [Leptospira sp. 2 VSF19]|uniref:Polyketide cyclase/dehydrase and lipid transport n=1 Tax=Leptospira soteropolitanensis TaxID=2950025 RepID=A0AAW5VPV2_9LEPT|nr:SRPBCC family protein [Leptospira soteropolitanensis]MCW7493327.1 polyketide cyclase/dehydrase and lipid transport [Leptospira soteropolitanensis]MCW7501141.1 polyketide cyclase/dehydrase and lipid transport [Leptospira soteropolitanensis]MCW7523179.1 polyketide cyclase/dehydrase and lipid transport [Leptospira soteropolitanensis]MCW7527040.1 polyketide cyclase/dehydrase and lipid transport [Leptospira soteropolitanensis]MCW7530897.1 polyketide cyclase/dehydrase and lipid transport [Leptosp
MIQTTIEAVIRRPVPEVFSYIRNMENQTLYNSSITASEVVSNNPNQYKMQIDLGIFKLTELYTLEEVHDNRLIVASCHSNSMTFTDRYEFKDSNGDCHLTITDRMELKGFFKLSEGLVKMNLKSQMMENLNSLKKILES